MRVWFLLFVEYMQVFSAGSVRFDSPPALAGNLQEHVLGLPCEHRLLANHQSNNLLETKKKSNADLAKKIHPQMGIPSN